MQLHDHILVDCVLPLRTNLNYALCVWVKGVRDEPVTWLVPV